MNVADESWLPIATAPRDGTPVKAEKRVLQFAADHFPGATEMRFVNGHWGVLHPDGEWRPSWMFPEPTHWQPLPPSTRVFVDGAWTTIAKLERARS